MTLLVLNNRAQAVAMASFSNHRINVQVGSMATKLKQVYFSYKQNKTKKSLTLFIDPI